MLCFFVLVAALAGASALPECTTDRPGWASHRTMYLPSVHAAAASESWASALCCVFTHVVEDAGAERPYMITYDGSKQWYDGNDSADTIMERAYDDVCDMGMGRDDCEDEASCVAAALAGDEPEPDPEEEEEEEACADSSAWRDKKKLRTCDWVAKKPKKRCKKRGLLGSKAKRACLLSCGKC